MALYSSADLLSDFKFLANREESDASLSDAQIYRLLTIAQQRVLMNVAAVFPRLVMVAPVQLVTSDGGETWTLPTSDPDGGAEFPYGHAEIYGVRSGGYELYGSSYGANGWGDIVFEGNKIRMPGGTTSFLGSGPWIRYAPMTATLNAATEPTLQPATARPLIVYKALELWASRGGLRDASPYRELYQDLWVGSGVPGDNGLLGLLSTQYKRSLDSAMEGSLWWRAHATQARALVT